MHRSVSKVGARSGFGFWLLIGFPGFLLAHDGPDPLVHWRFDSANVRGDAVQAILGPDLPLSPASRIVREAGVESLQLRGQEAGIAWSKDHRELLEQLPREAVTAVAWVQVDRPIRWGGIAGIIQDNGGQESGWLLGYNQNHFTFALASVGADDGDGNLTYLESTAEYEVGVWYHLAATYDGTTMRLYVNGRKDAESEAQSGPILYPTQATPIAIGRYQDVNEQNPMQGRIAELKVYNAVAKDPWIAHDYEHRLVVAEAVAPRAGGLEMMVQPYLQNVGTDRMTVMWQTTTDATSVVHYGPTAECEFQVEGTAQKRPRDGSYIHTVELRNLKPNTQYFYRVETGQRKIEVLAPAGTQELEVLRTEALPFQTAPADSIPFAFAVISDTQGNPKVSKQLATMAWEDRPSIVLHVGDLVDTGARDDDWHAEFFPGMQPLIGRVCFFPVLGNHEGDARNYYDYMSLPDPEYYYTFKYSNAQFFMIDSNRNVDPESEQYRWLESELAKSTATWKFVCHHHPPYSSDENDYGDLWKVNTSTRGTTRMRPLTKLYDQYGVDIVWNGHIHSYERTWPLKSGQATDGGGTIYMITGGGGGSLETPGPFRNFFENVVARGHHYVMVHLNGRDFEMKAYDLEGRLFDTLQLRQRE